MCVWFLHQIALFNFSYVATIIWIQNNRTTYILFFYFSFLRIISFVWPNYRNVNTYSHTPPSLYSFHKQMHTFLQWIMPSKFDHISVQKGLRCLKWFFFQATQAIQYKTGHQITIHLSCISIFPTSVFLLQKRNSQPVNESKSWIN